MTDPLYSDPLHMRSPVDDLFNDKTYVVGVYVLYLLGFFTGAITTLIGLIMAYRLKDGAGALAHSHYVAAIRTFWLTVVWSVISAVAACVAVPLCVILIGVPILVAAGLVFCAMQIWFVARCVIGLMTALEDRPYASRGAWGV
jgi:uncharacterized membrane protein